MKNTCRRLLHKIFDDQSDFKNEKKTFCGFKLLFFMQGDLQFPFLYLLNPKLFIDNLVVNLQLKFTMINVELI